MSAFHAAHTTKKGPRTEGWGSMDNVNGNAHYFQANGRSLCGKWLCLTSPRWESNQENGPEPKRGSGTCKACWTKAVKRHPADTTATKE